MIFFWIALAGGLGSCARYLICNWTFNLFGSFLPFGTLIVNAVGSFLIGILMPIGLYTHLISPTVRITLLTGFLGGFTTYSSFNYETLAYLQNGEFCKGIANFGIMSMVCLSTGMLGFMAVKSLMNIPS